MALPTRCNRGAPGGSAANTLPSSTGMSCALSTMTCHREYFRLATCGTLANRFPEALSMILEFWLEFASTYSYPATMRVEALAAEHDIEIAWRPFLLGPIFQEQGWRDSPFNLYPAKGNYMWRDLERICAAQQIPFQRPSEFPRSGILAARIACRFAGADWLPDFIRRVYLANFALDLDIASRDVIADCLSNTGESADKLIDEAQTPAAKLLLREQTERAGQSGIFGAPSFLVGKELFWGNDRLEDAVHWAGKQGN